MMAENEQKPEAKERDGNCLHEVWIEWELFWEMVNWALWVIYNASDPQQAFSNNASITFMWQDLE